MRVLDATHDLSEVPKALVDRLIHYFMTYKLMPNEAPRVTVAGTYDRPHAWRVIDAAIGDYHDCYDLAPPSLRF